MNTLYFVVTHGNLKYARGIRSIFTAEFVKKVESICLLENRKREPWAARVNTVCPVYRCFDMELKGGLPTFQRTERFRKRIATDDRNRKEHGKPKMTVFTHDLTPIENLGELKKAYRIRSEA